MGSTPLYPATTSSVESAVAAQQRGAAQLVTGSYIIPGWEINNFESGFAIIENYPIVYGMMIEVKQRIYVASIAARIAANSGAGGKGRVALYNLDSTTGFPSTLGYDLGSIETDSVGVFEQSIESEIFPGLYWQLQAFNAASQNADIWTWFETSIQGFGQKAFGIRGPSQKYYNAVPSSNAFVSTGLSFIYADSGLISAPTIESYVDNGFPPDLGQETFLPAEYSGTGPPLVFYRIG